MLSNIDLSRCAKKYSIREVFPNFTNCFGTLFPNLSPIPPASNISEFFIYLFFILIIQLISLNIYFFTFNPTRKATQIAFNPHVQCVIRPENEEGIKELQIDGFAEKITDNHEKEKAKQLILNVTKAFESYMNDEFLIENDVVGYYKIKPTVIKYVDFSNQAIRSQFPSTAIT